MPDPTTAPAARGPYVRGPGITPAQRGALVAILRAHPGATNREAAGLFRAATGRAAGVSTINACRRAFGLSRARCLARGPTPEPPPAPTDWFPGLPRDEAAALAWIVAHRPDLSPIQCVALLAAGVAR